MIRVNVHTGARVTDLLDEATHPGRRFDVVICESVARVARRTFEGLSVGSASPNELTLLSDSIARTRPNCYLEALDS